MGKTVARVINLVDNLDQINFGIWNAAIGTAEALKVHFGIGSQLWYPQPKGPAPDYQFTSVETVTLPGKGRDAFDKLMRNLNPDTDIIVSHGCWQWPTLWGNWFQQSGFRWMYVPHGMLEPWSMQQKSWKKKPYFLFIEKPKAAKAQVIRAVGAPEAENLKAHFSKVVLIPNGVDAVASLPSKASVPIRYLYLARLHFKKGPLQLAKAWKASSLCNHPDYQLLIVGPDEGEHAKIEAELVGVNNVQLPGPVYGDEKKALLDQSHYYLLPSLSEGFPTSVVEAMMHGLVPIISHGCNFPEVLEQGLGYDSGTTQESIRLALEQTVSDNHNWKYRQIKGHELVLHHYSIEAIAALQVKVFKSL